MEDIPARCSLTDLLRHFHEFQTFCAKCHPKNHRFHHIYLLLFHMALSGITYLKPSKFQNPKRLAMEHQIYKLYNFMKSIHIQNIENIKIIYKMEIHRQFEVIGSQ